MIRSAAFDVDDAPTMPEKKSCRGDNCGQTADGSSRLNVVATRQPAQAKTDPSKKATLDGN